MVRAGWDRGKLIKLSHALQTVLTNFERISQHRLRFKAVLDYRSQRNAEEVFALDMESREAYVYLHHGPEDVLEYAPFGISRGLAEIFFDTEGPMRDMLVGSMKSVVMKGSQINQGVELILSSFRRERGVDLEEVKVARMLGGLAAKGCQNLIRNKMSFALLRPYPVPAKYLETLIQSTITDLHQEAKKIDLNEKDLHSWEVVATLALISVLASKCGCKDYERYCRNVLQGDMGRELALDEYMVFGLYQEYLTMSEPQVKWALRGFDLIFGIFKNIYEYYYDKLMVEI